jgi:DNA-binding SARP family transcriptional activator
LREALGLWRGRALADLAFEASVALELERLEDLRLLALEDRVEADLALGRDSELVAELHALIAERPLRERMRAQLMLALYRSGRQAEALEAYRDARRALVEELGIEPGP